MSGGGAPEPKLEALFSKIQRYRDWSRRMLHEVQPSFPRTMEVTVTNEWPALGAAFVSRATNILEATLDLPEGRLTAAAILVRSLYEHVTMFAWLAADPATNLARWNLENIQQAVILHKDAVNLGFEGTLTPEKLATYEDKLKAAKENNLACPPRVPQLAREADAHWGNFEDMFRAKRFALFGMYPAVYRNFSSIAHGREHSIRAVISAGPVPGMCCIGVETGAGEANAFTIAPVIFAMCLLASSHALGFPNRDAVLRCLRDARGVVVD